MKMIKKRMKKGYYFSIESLMGILVLTSSFFLINTLFESPVPLPDYRYATNLVGFMSHVSVSDICSNGCDGLALDTLSKKYGIYDNSIIDMMGYTYYKSPGNVTQITEEIFAVGGMVLRGRDAAIMIRGIECDILYSTQNISTLDCDEGANVTNEVVFRKVITGYVINEDDGILDFWGDYVLEVRIW